MNRDDAVEIVVFDAGLTLVHADPSFVGVFAEGLRRAGVDVADGDLEGWGEAFRIAWRDHGDAWEAADEPSPHIGDLDVEERFWRGLYRRVLAQMELDGPHPEIAQEIHDAFLEPQSWTTYPEVHDVLDDLADSGIRTALLSNWGPSLRELLRHLDLIDRFEVVVISGEIGIAKPDRGIFDRTLEQLGELPGPHVAYVGDDPENDVAPSVDLGLRAVLVDRWDWRGEHDVPRVSDLRELPDVLPLVDRAEPA